MKKASPTRLALALPWLLLLAALAPFGCASGDDSGTGHPQEDCLNGKDDDEDGDVDCADSSCGGYACAAAIPDGFEDLGDVAVIEWPSGAAEPDCPSSYPDAVTAGVTDPAVPEAACSACVCGALTGGCELPDLAPAQPGDQAIRIESRICGDAGLATSFLLDVPDGWDGACYSPNAYLGGMETCTPGPCNVSVRTDPPVVRGTACESTGGDPAPIAWTTSAKVCNGGDKAGGGCEAGATCRARPSDDGAFGPCIATKGLVACPAPYTNEIDVYDPAEATPGTCSACQCDPPADATCAGTVTVYSDTIGTPCTTEVVSFPAGSCADLAGNPTLAGRTFEVTSPPSGGDCTASAAGGTPTSAASLGVPTTVCCLP